MDHGGRRDRFHRRRVARPPRAMRRRSRSPPPAGVSLATGRFGSWSVEDVAQSAGAGGDQTDAGTGPAPPTTSVAIDSQGTTWVAWQDTEGIHLASSGDGGFEEIELPDTSGGMHPSLAVTEDGASVYLAWYDSTEGDLRLGTYGEIEDLLIAAPPPLPSVAPPPSSACGEDGQIVLDIVAQGTAFDPTCLVAPAGRGRSRSTSTTKTAATVGQHNIAIAVDEASVRRGPDLRRRAGHGTRHRRVRRPRDRGGLLLLPLRRPPVDGRSPRRGRRRRRRERRRREAEAANSPSFPAGSPTGATMVG